MKTKQQGMALVAAIFLMVILAALGIAALQLNVAQQHENNLSMQSLRTSAATQAGLNLGSYRAVKGTCNPLTSLTVDGFNVQVSCSNVGGTYRLSATATKGTYGTADYVSGSAGRTI